MTFFLVHVIDCCNTIYSGLLVLKENRTSDEWEHRRLCVGDSEVCPGADSQPMFVSTLGQDDGGEVYVASVRDGTIYQITDPSRYIHVAT